MTVMTSSRDRISQGYRKDITRIYVEVQGYGERWERERGDFQDVRAVEVKTEIAFESGFVVRTFASLRLEEQRTEGWVVRHQGIRIRALPTGAGGSHCADSGTKLHNLNRIVQRFR